MSVNLLVKLCGILLFVWCNSFVFGQVTYKQKPLKNDPWLAESLWVGAGLIAQDSSEDIVVTYKRNDLTNVIGELFFMVPGYQDSARFVFHNFYNKFPDETPVVHIGKFAKGTEIVFMYKVTDTSYLSNAMRGVKFYTGQNRLGVDKYYCPNYDSSMSFGYGIRHALVGRIDSSRVEVGFLDYTLSFGDIVFEVTGVILTGVEKYKIGIINAAPTELTFLSSVNVSLSVLMNGNMKIVKNDTIFLHYDTNAIHIYYTTDKSSSLTSSTRKLYSGPIPLTSTTTINAAAVLENDTNWFAGEVMTQVYTKEKTSIRKNIKPVFRPATSADSKLYSMSGRFITATHLIGTDISSFTSSLPAGIYLLRYNGIDGVKRMAVRQISSTNSFW